MSKAQFYFKVTTLSFIALYFTACQPGESSSKSSSASLTYQLSENGCSTGKKSFTDLRKYCASLADDEANNGCASQLRSDLFAQRCESLESSQKQVSTAEGSQEQSESLDTPAPNTDSTETTLDRTPVETAPTETAPVEVPKKATPATSQVVTIPSEIQITAHPENRLSVQPSEDGTYMISDLTGKLVVDSMEPAINKTLNIGFAERITFIDNLGRCELSAKNFGSVRSGTKIDFTLIGTDPARTMESDSCLTRLSTLAMTGFTVEFTNVLTAGLNQDVIPKVVLKVEIK
ncbi:MAG: hypothetical protein J7501_18755 [Bdellovibrio sp.]|nr:hypothetical protein [Bdellovibrio sp.]